MEKENWVHIALLVVLIIFFLVIIIRSAKAENQTCQDGLKGEMFIPFTDISVSVGLYIPLPKLYVDISCDTAKWLKYFFEIEKGSEGYSGYFIKGVRVWWIILALLFFLFYKLWKIPKR